MTTPTTQREADEREPGIDLERLQVLADILYKRDSFAISAELNEMIQSTRQAAPEAPTLSGMRFILDPTMPPGTMRLESGEHSVTMTNIDFATSAATDQSSTGQVDAQYDLEAWAKLHGGLPLDRAVNQLKTDDGLLHFPTYKFGRTEIAWRAWANSRASLTPTAPAEQAKCQCYYGEYCPACATPTAPQAASQQAGPLTLDSLAKMLAGKFVNDYGYRMLLNGEEIGFSLQDLLGIVTLAQNGAPQAASPIRGFDRSLASIDAYDPQSFIDGAKWAEEKFLAPQAATTASADCTAVQLVRDLVQLWGNESLTTDEYNEAMSAIEDRMHAYIDGRAPVQAAQPALPAEPTDELLDMLGRIHPFAMTQEDRAKAYERLERAFVIQQPWPVPDQACIVWRADLMDMRYDLIHKQACFDSERSKRESANVAPGAAQTTDAREGGAK